MIFFVFLTQENMAVDELHALCNCGMCKTIRFIHRPWVACLIFISFIYTIWNRISTDPGGVFGIALILFGNPFSPLCVWMPILRMLARNGY